jgi:hypothetical protein
MGSQLQDRRASPTGIALPISIDYKWLDFKPGLGGLDISNDKF